MRLTLNIKTSLLPLGVEALNTVGVKILNLKDNINISIIYIKCRQCRPNLAKILYTINLIIIEYQIVSVSNEP
jgi:hypothetical protein